MQIKRFIKKLLLRIPFLKYVVLHQTKRIPRIFMYHHFGECAGAVDAATFVWQLQAIKGKFSVMTLGQYVKEGESHELPVAVITVDDGYEDFFTGAYPLLRQYELPATLFVTTQFVGRVMWFWFDKLKYILSQSHAEKSIFTFQADIFPIHVNTSKAFDDTWKVLADYCLDLLEAEKDRFVDALAITLQVDVPNSPPKDFMAATWEDLLEMTEHSVEIGSHTKTHPKLTLLEDDVLASEVQESKLEIEERMGREVSIMAYPFGTAEDYDDRVVDAVRAAGYVGAVVAHEAVLGKGKDPYRITRLGVSNDRLDFAWKLYGFEFLFDRKRFLSA